MATNRELVSTNIYFRPGHPNGPARVIAKYGPLTVVPCKDPTCCGGFDQIIQTENRTEYPVALELFTKYINDKLSQYYIAHHNPAPHTSNFESQFRQEEINLGDMGLKLITLGSPNAGVGSCLLLTYKGHGLMIDCGLTVAALEADTDADELESDTRALSTIYPDFSLIPPKVKIESVLVTHGHLDHYGGLGELFRIGHKPTILGSRFTTAIIARYLSTPAIPRSIEYQNFQDKETLDLGPFRVMALPVFHSIPGSFAYAIWLKDHPNEGAFVFSGDMKCRLKDSRDLFETINTFESIGRCKFLCLDSTNAERPGFTSLESQVDEGFINQIYPATGRVFVSLFSTHIDRIRELVQLANLMGKKIAILGQSFSNPLDAMDAIGVSLSYQIYEPTDADIVLIAGCQANSNSVSWRLSQGESIDGLTVEKNDLVIISASAIPGRLHAIKDMIKGFRRRSARVVVDSDFPAIFGTTRDQVHVSGHGSANDLRTVIETVQPAFLMPYHARREAMIAAADIAVDTTVLSMTDSHIVLTDERGTTINF